MRLTVFGASGGVGRLVVAQAVTRGHGVRAVYRTRPVEEAGVVGGEVVVTELGDARGVREAVRGAEAVISAVGIKRVNPKNPWSALASPRTLAEDFVGVLVKAMKEEGVGRVVFVSAAGVGDSAGAMSWPVRTLFARSNIGVAYADLARAEEVLSGSGVEYVAVRPTVLTDGRLRGSVRETERFGLMHSISRADVAAFCVEQAEAERVVKREVMITG